MATLFSSWRGLFGRLLPCAAWLGIGGFFATGSVRAEKIGRIGYVVTAQDRARAEALAQQAFVEFQQGDVVKALADLDEADRLKPEQPDSWNLRGMIYLRQKVYAKAREAFAHAAALDPALWAAQFNLAETSFQEKEYPRARKSFEHLLAQTDRFKQGTRWELIEYKVFLCCLLSGDLPGANERLAKLPATGATTPARLYAEAALAYQTRKGTGAPQVIATAQTKFPAQVNELFTDSLVQAGWQAPAAPAPVLAASSGLPPGVTLATTPAAGMTSPTPYYVVDPKVEAAAAEPLPLPDSGPHPIVGKITPALQTDPTGSTAATPKVAPTRVATTQATPIPQATPDIELEHKDLLLIE